MKKVILVASVLFATILGVKAQTTNTVKVNVVLNPTLSVSVDPSSGYGNTGQPGEEESDAVNLVFRNAQDYNNGVTKKIDNHLKVTSIGTGYKIYAQSSAQDLQREAGNGQSTMSGGKVSVQIAGGNKIYVNEMFGQKKDALVNSSVTNPVSSLEEKLSVTYKADKLDVNDIKNLIGGASNAVAKYSVNVIYTITTP